MEVNNCDLQVSGQAPGISRLYSTINSDTGISGDPLEPGERQDGTSADILHFNTNDKWELQNRWFS